MALTTEQLEQIEFNKAQQAMFNKLESVRMAKELLMENDRNKPVGERGISANDVTNFANTLAQYINQ